MAASIYVFGDSIGRGVVLDEARKKYQFLKEGFAQLLSKSVQLVVRNYSSFGCTAGKGLATLQKHEAELQSHDFIMLEYGGNDCDFQWAEIAEAPEAEHLPKTPLPEYDRLLTQMLQTVRAHGSQPVLLTLPPIDAGRYYRWFTQGMTPEAAAGILRWLHDVERIYRYQEMYSLAICRLALRERVPLVDLRSAFLERRDYQNLLCEDGIHPNQEGHALIGRVIAQEGLAFA